jgi:hypothetical protein
MVDGLAVKTSLYPHPIPPLYIPGGPDKIKADFKRWVSPLLACGGCRASLNFLKSLLPLG